MKKVSYIITSALLLLSLVGGFAACASGGKVVTPQSRLRVATTTSLYDTGLWSYLEPIFEEKYGVQLDILYTGTGQAIEYGKRGDVDVVAVHARSSEEQFVADGYGVKRVPFAYNYFVIVGPPSDPAGIRGLSPEDAFKRLAEVGSTPFVSRGDESGTHVKEKAIWKSVGYDYEKIRKASPWYIEAGRGMGPTLLMASEKQGYTLTDIGTFLTFKGKINLVPIVDKGGILLNVYSIIAVNPQKLPNVKYEMANKLINFLTSPEVQELIGNYGKKQYGVSLFTPSAGAEPQS